ncbi:MAG: transcription elongation factor GreB [Caenispirillum bisanense]|nr:transcription elongation factor GreB [Caenispirillum bisanense]
MADRDDDDDDEDIPLPAGGKFYMTPQGHKALVDELNHLWKERRPEVVRVVEWAASLGDRSENADYIEGKRELRRLDKRIRFLRKRLDNALVVDPSAQTDRSRVYFGATVTYVNSRDEERTVTIVGVDEADLTDGKINWLSPVARALLKAEVGDEVEVRTPGAVDMLEVLKISYPDA